MGKKDDATELIVLLACNGSAVGEEACRETTVSRANIVVVVERVKGLWLVLLPRFQILRELLLLFHSRLGSARIDPIGDASNTKTDSHGPELIAGGLHRIVDAPVMLVQVYEANASFNGSQQASASQTEGEAFVDRVLYIQATQPASRRLAQFCDVGELLRAIRDAIKVHRYLFLDGNILHRDVAESNIISSLTQTRMKVYPVH